MPGEAVASTPGTELEGRVVGDGSVVVPARAGVLGTCSLARGGGTRVEACLVWWLSRKNHWWFVGRTGKTIGEDEGAWAKSRRYGVRSARALAGGRDTSRHRGFGSFPQNRHPSFRVYGSRKNRVYLFRFCPYGLSSVCIAAGAFRSI